jgi:hypothetical protein
VIHRDPCVLLVYRNFMARHGNPQCHVGLGVSALHTVRVLRRHRIEAHTLGVWTVEDVRAQLRERPRTTHCVIEAPWISTSNMSALCSAFPDVHFIVRCHSQIGFLQVEAGAIRILRELLLMQDGVLNLSVTANSTRLSAFIRKTYRSRCPTLPNLYDVERAARKKDRAHAHRLLRIGSFGALRLLKNHTTSAAAALMVAADRGCDLEFWISTNREENGRGILDALRNMFSGLCNAKLVEHPWSDWAEFRAVAAHMDLVMQLSHTETFNVVTADAVAEGVPCCVSPAIEWVPPHWQVDPDRVEDAARVAGQLLSSVDAAEEGLRALSRYVSEGSKTWGAFLVA